MGTSAGVKVWGIHGGATGDAFALFTEHDVVALGWEKIGDLSKIPNAQEAFRDAVRDAYPEKKPGALPVDAGQLRRFCYDLAEGDVVAFSAKQDWTYRIGRVIGPYTFAHGDEPFYPHRRSVEWLKTINKDALSQKARFELGAAMSLFRVKRHAAEVLAQLHLPSASPPVVEEGDDDEQPDVLAAEQIEEATREFVLGRLRERYAGHLLEGFVGGLLQAMGYRAVVTKMAGDHGIDVVAGRGPLGLDPPILKVQVKSGEGATREPDLLKLNGAVEQGQGERGIVVSLGGFTKPAHVWADGKEWFQLIGPGDLVDLVLEHYDRLPEGDRDAIRLRRVFAPDEPGGASA